MGTNQRVFKGCWSPTEAKDLDFGGGHRFARFLLGVLWEWKRAVGPVQVGVLLGERGRQTVGPGAERVPRAGDVLVRSREDTHDMAGLARRWLS